jgi:hypothetical protein
LTVPPVEGELTVGVVVFRSTTEAVPVPPFPELFEPAVAWPRKNAAANAAAPSTTAIGTKTFAVIASGPARLLPA